MACTKALPLVVPECCTMNQQHDLLVLMVHAVLIPRQSFASDVSSVTVGRAPSDYAV